MNFTKFSTSELHVLLFSVCAFRYTGGGSTEKNYIYIHLRKTVWRCYVEPFVQLIPAFLRVVKLPESDDHS
jgi:hypothetical protein